MSGYSKPSAPQHHLDVLWPDAELDTLCADYDQVVLHITESTGIRVRLRCGGYIGYERSGAWDEDIVQSAALRNEGVYLQRCLAALRANPASTTASGSPDRNNREWKQLEITFIDGTHLYIVASKFEVSRPD